MSSSPRIRQDHPVKATLAAVIDRFSGEHVPLPLSEEDRLDGRTVLLTGGNRGLGRAVARDLAQRGGRVLLACRSGLPEAANELRRESGGEVEGLRLDLGDLDDVARFADELRDRRERVDVAVLNAGVVPARSRQTVQRFEEMFQVNYLANVLLLRRLLGDGVIPNRSVLRTPSAEREEHAARTGGQERDTGTSRPRIVFVSSESHRSAEPVPPVELGAFRPYGAGGSVAAYGLSKLLVETLAGELARRLGPSPRAGDAVPDVAVHSVCHGAVRTDIAREAPRWAKPALGLVMGLMFRAPEDAAPPVVYLAAGRALEGETGAYLHVTVPKSRAEAAEDPAYTRALWDAAGDLLAPWLDPAHARP